MHPQNTFMNTIANALFLKRRTQDLTLQQTTKLALNRSTVALGLCKYMTTQPKGELGKTPTRRQQINARKQTGETNRTNLFFRQ